MRKKWIAGLLSLVILLAVFSVPVSASEESDEICRKMVSDYRKAMYASGKESMQGYCGLLVSWQLYLTGVSESLYVLNGKDQYDYYRDMQITSGGFLVKDYPKEAYPTLLDALNAASYSGRKNVYNLLVGFDKTNTESGSQFGHACVIYAILDGNVYFCESYQVNASHTEGQMAAFSIEEFAQYFDDWATYEGLIEFGRRPGDGDADTVDLFVEMLTEAPLLEAMDTESHMIRTIKKGERLHAVRLTERADVYYYQIDDGQTIGYIPAKQAKRYLLNPVTYDTPELSVPERITEGETVGLSGSLLANSGTLKSVRVEVSNGESVLRSAETACEGRLLDLSREDLNNALDLSTLPVGRYTVTMSAVAESSYARYGRPRTQEEEQCVWRSELTVIGKAEKKAAYQAAATKETVPEETAPKEEPEAAIRADGWSYEDGTWYCWQDGAPNVGWFYDGDVLYYLDENGAAATGDVEINGAMRRFSPTGALHSGWEYEVAGTRYVLSGGISATGWCRLDGVSYHFGRDGYLDADCWVEDGTQRIYMGADGTPANGWAETDSGKFYFEDGAVQVQFLEKKKAAELRFKALDQIPETDGKTAK